MLRQKEGRRLAPLALAGFLHANVVHADSCTALDAVGETRGFLERGGTIHLVEIRGRVRFEIDRRAAERAGLTMSSLLWLALNAP